VNQIKWQLWSNSVLPQMEERKKIQCKEQTKSWIDGFVISCRGRDDIHLVQMGCLLSKYIKKKVAIAGWIILLYTQPQAF
jgi:hypothetical protein